jgi:hypothetical protein
MFRTDLLSIIRSLNTVYATIGICHARYVDCLLARSGWNLHYILKLQGLSQFEGIKGQLILLKWSFLSTQYTVSRWEGYEVFFRRLIRASFRSCVHS